MTDANHQADVLVIGAGIAGASLAAELARHVRVIVLEREAQPGYHTTGRSAAIYSQVYGPPQIRALSRASAAFFDAPPAGFATHPLLRKRVVALVGRQDQAVTVAATFEEVRDRGDVGLIEGSVVRDRIPLLRDGYAAAALMENSAADIDVHALHHGYLRRLKEAGGKLFTTSEVRSLGRVGDAWQVETGSGTFSAPVVVNAAGAWADEIARLADVAQVGLVPKRRTALIIDGPDRGVDDAWPMVVDIDEQFYLKPDAGRLLISPADETPSPPCDAQPEELDIAICIDRIERAFDLQVRQVTNRWAGLRSFVADKTPVVGFAPDAPGFFWLAGQGGYGIQSAPAMARLAAALIAGHPMPDDLAAEGVDAGSLSPQRAAIQNEVMK